MGRATRERAAGKRLSLSQITTVPNYLIECCFAKHTEKQVAKQATVKTTNQTQATVKTAARHAAVTQQKQMQHNSEHCVSLQIMGTINSFYSFTSTARKHHTRANNHSCTRGLHHPYVPIGIHYFHHLISRRPSCCRKAIRG